jgi:predicted ATPase
VFATGGDGFAVAFARAGDALTCALEAQITFAGIDLPAVRMGLHTGEAEERDGDYFGPAVNRAARLMALGHGGQVLVSVATRQVVTSFDLRDLGEHRMRDLSEPERVFQLIAPALRAEFPPLRSLDVLATNLPVQLTSFVGREDDVKAVLGLLDDHRMVTLTGVGGVGKTRLALQAAAEALERFPDGVWLVELAALDTSRVVDAVARALRVEIRADSPVEATLVEAVKARQLLVLLDNCEHLVREARRVSELLLREARGLSVLATSREGLRVPGEQLFSVPSLRDEAALKLFVERARASVPEFTLDDQSHVAAEALCDRLDGMPLAIELAAARVRMFRVEELARRVEQRFRLLTGGRGEIERHQTLRAAIDWSYGLLDEVERVVFGRLSVFASGATFDAAEAVVAGGDVGADEVLDVIAGLVDKSLVLVDRSQAETRYVMLETIRQYAQERLVDSGEAEEVRARHAQWYAGFARFAGRGLYSADELAWLERLRPELDNLQVALAWAVGAEELEVSMRIAGAFPRQGVMRPLLGTAQLAERALEVKGFGTHPARARVLAEAGWAAAKRGDTDVALQRLERSIAEARQGARFPAAAFSYLLTVAGWVGGEVADRQLESLREGLSMAEASGDVVAATGLRLAFATQAAATGSREEALVQARRGLAEAHALHQPTLETSALYVVSLLTALTDPAGALRLMQESAELASRHGIDSATESVFALLAYLEARHGDRRRALEALYEQARAAFRSPLVARAAFYVGTSALTLAGRADLAALCEGNTRQLPTAAVARLYEAMRAEEIGEARAALGPERFEQLASEAAAMAPEDFNARMVAEIAALLDQVSEAWRE